MATTTTQRTTTLGPCSVCGSTRSRRGYQWGGDRVVCEPNANGRDRCREREVAIMLREARADCDHAVNSDCPHYS